MAVLLLPRLNKYCIGLTYLENCCALLNKDSIATPLSTAPPTTTQILTKLLHTHVTQVLTSHGRQGACLLGLDPLRADLCLPQTTTQDESLAAASTTASTTAATAAAWGGVPGALHIPPFHGHTEPTRRRRAPTST